MPHLVFVVGADPYVLISLNIDSAAWRSYQKRIVMIVGYTRKRREIHAADAGQELAIRMHLGEMAVAVNRANLSGILAQIGNGTHVIDVATFHRESKIFYNSRQWEQVHPCRDSIHSLAGTPIHGVIGKADADHEWHGASLLGCRYNLGE